MATYAQIADYVWSKFGYKPKTCWIADVKAMYGLTKGDAPNRISSTARTNPCPSVKIADIEAALRQFGMISNAALSRGGV